MFNRLARLRRRKLKGGLAIGSLIIDGKTTKQLFYLPHNRRVEHIVIIGKTGSGKSFLIKFIGWADVPTERGLIIADFHGDLIPFFLAGIAEEEHRTGRDLASRVVVIRPGDPNWAVGINVLSASGQHEAFVQAAAITAILKERWGMEHFGPRTEELLRNSLLALMANGLTLLELSPLLSDDAFRAQCLRNVANPDVREYFESRFEPLSDAMKAVMRDPILNKTSEFTSDPSFKFILGQQSTFSFDDVLSTGKIVLIDLNKGRLGKHASTLGSLIFALIKAAVFRRSSRKVFTIFADEVHNLLTADTDFDTYFAEFRKFAVSVCIATQTLESLPKRLQAAAMAIGTHIFFQLSPTDAQQVSAMLDGGKPLQELLKNLPKRQLIIKSGHYKWQRVQVPEVKSPTAQYADLLQRSQNIYARRREMIEAEILNRRPAPSAGREALHEWE